MKGVFPESLGQQSHAAERWGDAGLDAPCRALPAAGGFRRFVSKVRRGKLGQSVH